LTNLAVAGSSVYVSTLDESLTYTNLNLRTATTGASKPAGEIEALNLSSGKVEWDKKVPQLPLGAVTVSHDLIFTTLYDGALLAVNRSSGRIVYRRRLPTSTNSPIAVAGNTVIVPAGGPVTRARGGGGDPQIVAYTAP
jgi:outer membrane protein assembly factor BamB